MTTLPLTTAASSNDGSSFQRMIHSLEQMRTPPLRYKVFTRRGISLRRVFALFLHGNANRTLG